MISFLGIGGQKCGTTWLYENLARHPGIYFPAGKEVHFWDRSSIGDEKEWLNLFLTRSGTSKCGEITPGYAILAPSTIERIAHVAPDIRLFYVVRNPIARAWSAALMGLRRAQMHLTEASDQWFIDHFRSRVSVMQGDYAKCISNWLSCFRPSNLQVIWFDDIVSNPRSVLSLLAKHLSVDPMPLLDVEDDALRRPVNASFKHQPRPGFAALLREIHAKNIQELERLTGRDLTHWLRWEGPNDKIG